jgi:hypothetical protein
MMFFDEFAAVVTNDIKIKRDDVLIAFDKYLVTFLEIESSLNKKRNHLEYLMGVHFDNSFKYSSSKHFITKSPVLSSLYFGKKQLSRIKKSVLKDLREVDALFEKHHSIEKSDWKKDIDLSVLQISVGLLTVETLFLTSNKYKERYQPVFLKLKEMLEGTIKAIDQADSQDLQKVKMTILSESRKLLKNIRSDHVPAILDVAQKSSILSVCKNLVNRLEDENEKIDSIHTVFASSKIKNGVVISKSLDIPLPELVKYKAVAVFSKEYQVFIESLKKNVEKLIRKTSELDKIVDYNLDAALSLLRKNEEIDSETAQKSVSIAREGLERAVNLTKDLDEIVKNSVDKVFYELPQLISKYIDELEELTFAEKLIQLNVYLLRKRTVRNFKENFGRFRSVLDKNIPELARLLVKSFKEARSNYGKLKKITGLSRPVEEIGVRYSATLNAMDEKIAKIPYIYQRLFSIDTLPDNTFFIGREDVFSKLRNDFEIWKKRGVISTVIVAEKGNGKTTYLDIAKSDILKEFPLHNIFLGKTVSDVGQLFEIIKESLADHDSGSFEELEEKIAQGGKKKIVVFDNFQNIFLRTMDGFEAVERFLLFMEKTQKNIFWIVSSGVYGWNFLDLSLNVSRYFNRIIPLKGLDEKELSEIIMRRHNSSGYDIVFMDPQQETNLLNKLKKAKSSDQKEDMLKEHYFEKLLRMSAGNIRTSILFWLNSITEITHDEIKVSSDMITDFPFIANLPKEEKFALMTLIIHDKMTISDYAAVSRESEDESRKLLLRLYNRGLLLYKNDVYEIHPFIFRDVVRTLKSLNMLH